jgi:hypothetical protein
MKGKGALIRDTHAFTGINENPQIVLSVSVKSLAARNGLSAHAKEFAH